jgi:hypothetical protein
MPRTEQVAEFLSQTRATQLLSPESPISRDTAQRLHDEVKGPRDSSGRRVWTPAIVEQARKVLAQRAALKRGKPE